MRKIACRKEDGTRSIAFTDYTSDKQLKEFYKIYKKTSGRLIVDYVKAEGSILVDTGTTTDSIAISWRESRGCSIHADDKDVFELVILSYDMLCYRYDGYEAYFHLFDELRRAKDFDFMKEFEATASVEEGISQDIAELLALLKN